MNARAMALIVAAAGLALWGVLAAVGIAVMPSYLAAWLFWMALPLGALPLVMALELMRGEWPVLPVLRRMLLLLPVGAVLALPVMLRFAPLYQRPGLAHRLPAAWMAPGAFLSRMVVVLVLWVLLALLFSRTPRRARPGLAVLGLMAHLLLVTLAALDWVMALDPGVASSAFGVLLLAAQVGTALAAALFVVAVSSRDALPEELVPLLGTALGGWVFLHLMQYLVIWSANLPDEIVWYQVRMAGLGAPAVWFGVAAAVLTFAAMVPHGFIRTPWVMASVAAMLLVAHLVEMLWLVTPPFRGALVPGWADLPALLGLGGVVVFVLAPLLQREGGRHAAA